MGSVLSKVLAVVFIAAGVMIIGPSAAYAAQVTCTGITIEGDDVIDKGGNANYTAYLTFNVNVSQTDRPSISIQRSTDSLQPGNESEAYRDNVMSYSFSVTCPSNVSSETQTISVGCGGISVSKTIQVNDPNAPHSITVNKNGGGNSMVSASATSAAPGTTITLTATPADGYSFVSWNSTNTDITNPTSATGASFRMPSTAVTITADFSGSGPAPTVYNVTVTTDGHGEAYANKRSGVSGTKVMLKEVPDDGYRFKQWEVISGGVELDNYRDYTTSFTIKSAHVEIKAHFEKKEEHTRENDYESKSEAAWTPAKAAATIAVEKAAKQEAASRQMAVAQTLLRTLATTKPTNRPEEARKVIGLDMTKVDILDPATVNLLTLNSKFAYNIKISVAGGLTNTVTIPANFNFRPFIKEDGTMNIHEVLWSIILSRK